MDDNGLNERQVEFCRRYLIWRNAAKAYRDAGYEVTNNDSAASAGWRLLRNVEVQAEIERQWQAMAGHVTAEWCVQEMKLNLERCIQAGNLAAANKAIEILGRIPGAFPNQVEVSGGTQLEITCIDVSHDSKSDEGDAERLTLAG